MGIFMCLEALLKIPLGDVDSDWVTVFSESKLELFIYESNDRHLKER